MPATQRSVWLSRLTTAVMLAAIAAAGLTVTVRLLGYKILTEQSGSMRPAIGAGNLILCRPAPADRARTGDIVTFADPADPDRLLTHRITGTRRDAGGVHVRTRGDANTAEEVWTVPTGGTVLTVVAVLPGLGWLRLPLTVAAGVLATAAVWRLRPGRRRS